MNEDQAVTQRKEDDGAEDEAKGKENCWNCKGTGMIYGTECGVCRGFGRLNAEKREEEGDA